MPIKFPGCNSWITGVQACSSQKGVSARGAGQRAAEGRQQGAIDSQMMGGKVINAARGTVSGPSAGLLLRLLCEQVGVSDWAFVQMFHW